MEYPEDLRYSAEHEWVRRAGDTVTVGITDFAQDALGDVVYVAAPEVGRAIAAGESIGEIESTKSVSEIYSPSAGAVVAVNADLEQRPELLNSDPFGEGWIAQIQLANADDLDHLMDAAAYRNFVEG